MADTLTDLFSGLIQVKMVFTRLDNQELGYAQNKKNATTIYSLADGSASGEAESVYAAQRTAPAAGIDSVDLLNLQQDNLGSTVSFSFAKLRVLRVVNKSPTAGEYIYFGASETNPTQSFAIAVGPGSEALIVNHIDNYEVVSGNNVLRTYNPNATPVDYELYLIGSPA